MKLFFIIVFGIVSCKQSTHSLESDIKYRFLTSRSKYANTHQADSLIFGFDKGTTDFDTSWTLLVSRSGNKVVGNLNYLLPRRVTGFNDFLDESCDLLHYNGFSFSISRSKWDSLIILSGIEDYSPKDTVDYFGCAHCPSYELYFQSNIIVNSKGDRNFLKVLSQFFEKELINPFFYKLSKPQILIERRIKDTKKDSIPQVIR